MLPEEVHNAPLLHPDDAEVMNKKYKAKTLATATAVSGALKKIGEAIRAKNPDMEIFWNIVLQQNTFSHDLNFLMFQSITTEDVFGRRVLWRYVATLLVEFSDVLPQLYGKPFTDMCISLGLDQTVLEEKKALMRPLHQFKQTHNDWLRITVRNNIGAHRSLDSVAALVAAKDLEFEKVSPVFREFEDINSALASLLTKIYRTLKEGNYQFPPVIPLETLLKRPSE